MSKDRIKLPKATVPVPKTREQAEALVGEIAQAKIEERAWKAEMDTEITAIKQGYERRLAKLAEKITPMVEAIHGWADTHEAEFAGKKSLDMLHGVIGWRITPPALKPCKGYTWAAVVERIKALARLEFLRVKEEPNKEAILAARDSENLKDLFCQVVQEDEFYVEPKLSDTETREKAA